MIFKLIILSFLNLFASSKLNSINHWTYNFNNFDLSEDLKSTIIENVFQSDLDYGMDPIEDSDGKIVFLSNYDNSKERDSIFLIKCNSELVSIANLKKGYIIPRRNFNN